MKIGLRDVAAGPASRGNRSYEFKLGQHSSCRSPCASSELETLVENGHASTGHIVSCTRPEIGGFVEGCTAGMIKVRTVKDQECELAHLKEKSLNYFQNSSERTMWRRRASGSWSGDDAFEKCPSDRIPLGLTFSGTSVDLISKDHRCEFSRKAFAFFDLMACFELCF